MIEGLGHSADLWLAETLSCIEEAELVGEMLASDARPLWLSFTLNDEGPALLRSGETIAEAVAVGGLDVAFVCAVMLR